MAAWAPLELEYACQGVEWRREQRDDEILLLIHTMLRLAGGKPDPPEMTLRRRLGDSRMPVIRRHRVIERIGDG